MAPGRRSVSPPPHESRRNSSSSSTAAMILLVMGYVVALSEKLQAEFENFYHPNNSSSDTSLATRRHGDEELHAPDPQDAQQETKKNYRASNRLAVSVAAFLRKFSSPSSSSTVSSTRRCARAQKQQQQQQHSRAPVFAAPSTASDVYPPAATRRGSGATAWARKVRLGSSGIRSAPRVAQQEQGLLPAAAASTRRARLTDKTLCLDLDETLVHARGDVREMGENRFDFMLVFPQRQRHHRQNEQAGPGSQQQQQQCSTAGGGRGRGGKGREAGAEQKEVDGRCKRVFVRKRPHLKEFLEAAAEMFEVVLFTAAPAKFAQAVVEQIDPEGKLVDHVLPRESCTRLRFDGSSSSSSSACGGGRGRGSGERGPASVVKDLEVVGRPLSKVIMVENSLDAIRYHLENGVHISSFYGDREDTGLLSTLEALKALAPMTDVRDGIIRLSVETQARNEGYTLMPDGSISPAF